MLHEDQGRMGPGGTRHGPPRAGRRTRRRPGRVRGVPRGRRQGLREDEPRPDLRGRQGLPGVELHELPHRRKGARGGGWRQEAAEPHQERGAGGERLLPLLPRRPQEAGPLGGQRPPAGRPQVRELPRRAQHAHRHPGAGEDAARRDRDHEAVPRVPRRAAGEPAPALQPPDARRPDAVHLLPQPARDGGGEADRPRLGQRALLHLPPEHARPLPLGARAGARGLPQLPPRARLELPPDAAGPRHPALPVLPPAGTSPDDSRRARLHLAGRQGLPQLPQNIHGSNHPSGPLFQR